MGAKASKDKKLLKSCQLLPFLDVDVNINPDEECSFSGITCLKGGKIVVADYLGRCVKLYDTKLLELLDFVSVDSPPYEVCTSARDSNEVFVTLPFQQKILQLKADDDGIAIAREIQAEGMCYGIASFQEGLAVSLRIEKHNWQIEIIDYFGSVRKVFKDDDDGRELFGYPDYMAVDAEGSRLYISDGVFNTVVCLNLKDSNMITAKEIFRYKDKHLSIPKGLSLDKEGNLFVIGCESNNVHKISRNGKKLGIVLSQRDGLQTPMGLYYDRYETKVFVTEGSRKVMIFKDKC